MPMMEGGQSLCALPARERESKHRDTAARMTFGCLVGWLVGWMDGWMDG